MCSSIVPCMFETAIDSVLLSVRIVRRRAEHPQFSDFQKSTRFGMFWNGKMRYYTDKIWRRPATRINPKLYVIENLSPQFAYLPATGAYQYLYTHMLTGHPDSRFVPIAGPRIGFQNNTHQMRIIDLNSRNAFVMGDTPTSGSRYSDRPLVNAIELPTVINPNYPNLGVCNRLNNIEENPILAVNQNNPNPAQQNQDGQPAQVPGVQVPGEQEQAGQGQAGQGQAGQGQAQAGQGQAQAQAGQAQAPTQPQPRLLSNRDHEIINDLNARIALLRSRTNRQMFVPQGSYSSEEHRNRLNEFNQQETDRIEGLEQQILALENDLNEIQYQQVAAVIPEHLAASQPNEYLDPVVYIDPHPIITASDGRIVLIDETQSIPAMVNLLRVDNWYNYPTFIKELCWLVQFGTGTEQDFINNNGNPRWWLRPLRVFVYDDVGENLPDYFMPTISNDEVNIITDARPSTPYPPIRTIPHILAYQYIIPPNIMDQVNGGFINRAVIVWYILGHIQNTVRHSLLDERLLDVIIQRINWYVDNMIAANTANADANANEDENDQENANEDENDQENAA